MFSTEKAAVQSIKNIITNLEEEMLPRSFPGDDEVEEALNLIKRHLDTITSSLYMREAEINAQED
ncbi:MULTISPECIES: hypothetical protein [Acinetobacter]|uniref:Uncharacterized protein n=1 Tax=Acinetobacter variabilis TaxID=70346 RepID=N8X175_9GAMM|nr:MULTISPECIES: hypothetical protein [Acinetobacter]ENV00905.1 hypothetical protein F969_00100 [Acinetobacter variabilis]MDP1318383.1 hypothetical protein [Acinetobacter lwoffii]